LHDSHLQACVPGERIGGWGGYGVAHVNGGGLRTRTVGDHPERAG
jgi:hypothetical protein